MTSLAPSAIDTAKAVPGAVGAVYARAATALSSTKPCASLSSPLQLGDLTLRNRNIMASLTRNRSVPSTVPNDANILYYKQRAEGGCGLILSEGTLISQQGTEWPHAPGIWSDEQAAAWKKVTDSVHDAGGLIFCQLWHVGRVAHPDMPEQKLSGKPVPGPSAIAANGGKFRDLPGEPGYVTPTALEDPWTIVEEFRNAAHMAKAAGFDGVELHSANGYLVHQFIDSGSNHRTDDWGGSIENRCKLGLEVLKVLVEIWGASRVGIKITPTAGYNDLGMPLPETIPTFTYYITQIAAMKLAYVQLVRYVPVMDLPLDKQTDETEAETDYKRGVPHDVIAVYGPLIKPPAAVLEDHKEERVRGSAMPDSSAATNPVPTRLFINGGFTPNEADKLISDGVVDAVVFGQLWIGNPDLQNRIEAGLDVGDKGINDAPNVKTFYQAPSGNPHEGYTDYATAALAAV